MANLWYQSVQLIRSHFFKTGLEQAVNQADISGTLAVPELSAAARQMDAEGIVLLKNENSTLPLRAEDTVAVFGRCAVNYFTVGYGSGGDVIAPYRASLMDGLRQQSVRLDETLAGKYAAWCNAHVPEEGVWGHWPLSYPEMPLSEETVRQAAKESTVALVVIGRAAGEERENKLAPGSFYLTRQETHMLDLVTACFRRVCVVLDCGNVMDISWAEKYGSRIGALVYAWQGGMESGYALADILTGKICPSGRLTDTIAQKYADYPGSRDFGAKEHNCYTEDIYVGYRYFETFSPEKVQYPFGYGLSYTEFSLTSACTRKGDLISVHTTVSNCGNCPGKQVVQVYLCPPCGKLGNPAKVLAAFGKTRTLVPGEQQELTMDFRLTDFAAYDDSGITGCRSCFVLEPGCYRVAVGANVRDTETVLAFENDALQVVRRIHEAAAVKPGCGFQRLINRDGQPAYAQVPVAQKDLKAQILSQLPQQLPKGDGSCRFQDILDGKRTVEDFVAQLTEPELDDLTHGQGKMNSPLGVVGNAGALGGVTEQLRARGIPAAITTDGPSGVRIRKTVGLLPCGTALACSFNTEGVEQLYRFVSREMACFGSHMLLAPGMNIHRNPLCGRNFEYFSEDPHLTGKMAAAVIRGIQFTGRSACPKHFACNNQERNRNRNDSRVSERALREIYLRGFELAIKEASPKAIMTSYNKVNGVWSHYHYELVTQILRNEWGYRGLVITDWWMQQSKSPEFPNIRDDAYRIRAQVDVLMPGEIGRKNERTLLPSLHDAQGVTLAEAQRCAVNVIRFLVRIEQDTRQYASNASHSQP